MMEHQDLLNGKYHKYKKIGEGSSGKVYLCRQVASPQDENSNHSNSGKGNLQAKPTIRYFALKKIRLGKGINPENVNEFEAISHFKCSNLMSLEESFIRDKGYVRYLYMVMDYMICVLDLLNIKELKISDVQIKQICYQLVCALEYLHTNNYLHRDVKPENIMLTREGVLKLSDFSITTKKRQTMTVNTTTRWYRAPELMFGEKQYGPEIDIWSLGCTFAQLYLHDALFQGTTDISQLEKIFSVVGYPKDNWPTAKDRYPYYLQFEPGPVIGLRNIIPNADEDFIDLLTKLLTLDPAKRPTIQQVKAHKYFQNVSQQFDELGKVVCYIEQKRVKLLLK